VVCAALIRFHIDAERRCGLPRSTNLCLKARIGCSLFLIIALPLPRAKANESLDWRNVLLLRVGESISVTLDNAKHTGTVEKVDAGGIFISTKHGASIRIARSSVKAIRERRRLLKPGIALVAGGVLVAGGAELAGSVRDANAVSRGEFPGKSSAAITIAGFAAAGVGAVLLLLGGGKTIYVRSSGRSGR
jgi:hypothetical protein